MSRLRQILFGGGAALSALAAGGLVAVLPSSPVATFAVVVAVLAASCIAAVAISRRLYGDVLSLLSLSAGFYLLAFALGGTFAWSHRVGMPPYTSRDLTIAALVALVGWLSFAVGYIANVCRFFGALLPRLSQEVSARSVSGAAVVVPMLVIGWIARVQLARTGHYFHTAAVGATSSRAGAALVVAAALPLLATACVTIDVLRGGAPPARRVLALLLVVAEVAWAMPSGSRADVVTVIVMLAVLAYYRAERRGRRWAWISAAVAVFVIFPFGAAYRGGNVGYRTETRASLRDAFRQTFERGPVSFVLNGYDAMAGRFADITSIAVIVHDGRRPLGGNSAASLGWVAESLVPRRFLPGKTDVGTVGTDFAYKYGYTNGGSTATSVSITQVGEFFLNFGLIGVLIGLTVIGGVYRVINDYCAPRRTNAIALAIYAVAAGQLVSGEETIVALGLVGVLKTVVLLLLILSGLVYSLRRRGPAMAAVKEARS